MFYKPRSDTNKHSHPRCHYTHTKKGWKPKHKYESLNDAISFINSHHLLHYFAYKCPVCNNIHIGYKK